MTFILSLLGVAAGAILLWIVKLLLARAARKERQRREENQATLNDLRLQREVALAKLAELRQERAAHLATLAELRQALATSPAPAPDPNLPPLPAGMVRADTCPPGMVEVKMIMPPGGRPGEYDAMGEAMSAHEGGQGKGVSLVDQRKNSASHLGGD